MRFSEKVQNNQTAKIHIMQLNIGRACNLSCRHCHVEAGPKRTERMSRETFDLAMKVFDQFGFDTIDITGGEPTIHPDFAYFVTEAKKHCSEIIVRSNLVHLDQRLDLIALLKEKQVRLVASLPCYTAENTDAMRGEGSFEKITRSIRVLNQQGYGKELTLDLVYNPLGAFLPGCQKKLEAAYKEELGKLGLEFSSLLTITNLPLGHFKEQLVQSGETEQYQQLLEDNFNPATVDQIMCRYQVSVSYDGTLYDCDFNQMADLPIQEYPHLTDLLAKDALDRKIIFQDYCYGCSAGAGSSCGGALKGYRIHQPKRQPEIVALTLHHE